MESMQTLRQQIIVTSATRVTVPCPALISQVAVLPCLVREEGHAWVELISDVDLIAGSRKGT